jgi:acetyl esterase/lipase
MRALRLLAFCILLVPALAAAASSPEIEISPRTQREDVFPRAPVAFAAGVTALPDVEYSNLIGYRPLLLDLYLPSAGTAHPLVVWIHGGGWSRGDSRGNGAITDFPTALAGLAARGYVVASVNYRLSGEAKFPAQIQDVNAAIAYLKTNAARYHIDPSRVLLWGGSAGGHLAALAALTCDNSDYAPEANTGRLSRKEASTAAATKVSTCVQGAVIWYGVSEIGKFHSDNFTSLMGCDCPEKMAMASPVNRVTAKSPPMLLIHGTADSEVPVEQSHALETRLKANGVSVQALYLPDVDHGFIGKTPETTRDATLTALEATFAFIDRVMAPRTQADGLPVPTGPYPVGFQAFELRDLSRTNAPASDDSPRTLRAFIFYPSVSTSGPARTYLADADLTIPAMARNFHYDAASLSDLRDARAHSFQDAPSARGHFPVVFFSHGFRLYALQSTALLEEVASHGYVVIVLTHPGDAADFRLDDGRVIRTFEPPQPQNEFNPAKQLLCCAAQFAQRIAAIPEYSRRLAPTRLGTSAVAWRDDILFATQSVYDGRVPRQIAEVLKQADLQAIAFTGMSFGGSIAAGACHQTPLCKAAINLDGGPYDTNMFNRPIRRPLLIVHSDWIDLPIKGSPYAMGFHPDDLQFERWADAGNNSDILCVRVKGIRHMALSDLPYLMRGEGREDALGNADPMRSGEAVSRLWLAFLNAYLKGQTHTAMKQILARYSNLERHDPSGLRTWARSNPDLASRY